jgi:hypothetical protein
MKSAFVVAAIGATLAGCAKSETIRVSADSAIIQTSAAPACGSTGAAKVAQKQAAIETIKAGYDRYIIVGSQNANNVDTTVLPGSSRTSGNLTYGGGYGTYNETTTYTPTVITSGTHDQAFAIRMFKDGDPNGANAIPARDILGPEWEALVKEGAVRTCT